ncbi:fused isobutyryl-CoA mutase/GTPase IcmF [Ralstonia mannitolilytica]|uniref:Fused isobutyryl-CoA mutase n=1 Tax=Ralstonia mannitolilytica TaxID=105219 RepID=A0AAJ4ZII1_9RALS|nr:fused isobutyryl-CoA mutase/GTPase IcmF [Ralstonia mannitolilytica]CAG2146694.1 Fused isobutyryl-CoA mutase [Ralstonia mannitolilytica]CAJ0726949.1 Fused isobutyryl-CoA mutase [Ralstonia mannitolilytica]SUD86504.1 Methylmalonyl-CoA mutase [Ralstonia mannitolilytica]SUD92448.1 Methylmalonyl-CoA mutase [Ralstonia mannitolilytica]SUD96165.1 Methylmalonyl-CoA mutase [Ralstonia mannitolilytica]
MTDLSAARAADPTPASAAAPVRNKVRFVTAASLFDGHDASINIMRRILQSMGCEVIHLGHNRSVDEVVNAALQEDVQGIAVSSYQGGHVEYFKYMIDALRARGGEHIQVFGGGGGVIVPAEIRELQDYGVARIYSPEDGQRMGLAGMIADMVQRCDIDLSVYAPATLEPVANGDRRALAQLITALESGRIDPALRDAVRAAAAVKPTPVVGITGTGGAGKSSLTDELIRRFRLDQKDTLRIAVISIDPSRRKSGGALLGDRIRMNAINHPNIFVRSLATREASREISDALPDVIAACRAGGFDLVIVETSGIGQGDAAIVPHVDLSLYVMTPEFGAASQLEKIDMLDFADLVAINKFDRKGAQDAWRDVAKQVQRNREQWHARPEDMPVFGTQASHFNDDGVTALYHALADRLAERGMALSSRTLPRPAGKCSTSHDAIVPPARARYLAEVADTVRGYHRRVDAQSRLARERQQLRASHRMLEQAGATVQTLSALDKQAAERDAQLGAAERKLLAMWPDLRRAYSGDEYVVKIRDKEIRTQLTHTTLSGTTIRKVVLPPYEDDGEVLRWLMRENVPGSFPYTAGVFAFKRENEDPTRMFAGEGDAFRTNRRFKLVSEGMEAKRLSTAFDSVTLYGEDPAVRPDIYGKIGNSGVSIATLDDMKVLYDGFDLTSPNTSVSMTINGPAPTILAMFMNTAIDQNLDKFRADNGREPTQDEEAKIRAWVLQNVRGTVQADILKEDQGQNTCIFSTEFSLKVMGDIQEYFVHHQVRNFYSVSISGYHIAEAGANPISQLAFTLANGFTYVEAYLARGMHIDDFAPNLSFFFSNGMDPEYSVLGRVARRIWAVTLRDKYGANERSQKLKYHVQTSGRSLHAQEIAFNDIRTTLQALIAIYDNCNSLHTNAYDEAITTPTAESVRRALAIQLIINREWGLAKCENPNQGSFIIDELTDLVEEAVLQEFERIAERGGVLGAMETGYQRGKIQEESMLYEQRKHDGSLPIIGVNTFRNPDAESVVPPHIELARSSEEEKQSQLARLEAFHARHAREAPAMLQRLQRAVIDDQNVFAVLMDAVRVCSLGQITHALFEVGGQYRRNM